MNFREKYHSILSISILILLSILLTFLPVSIFAETLDNINITDNLKNFTGLTYCEQKLFDADNTGGIVDCSQQNKNRGTIRAELLYLKVLETQKKEHIIKWIYLKNAIINNAFIVPKLATKLSVLFENCQFNDDMKFIDTEFQDVSFINSTTKSIYTSSLKINNNFLIRNNTTCSGSIDLTDATIKNNLVIENSNINNTINGVAIDGTRINVGGTISLEKSTIIGATTFQDAQIGGNIIANDAILTSKTVALNLDRAKIARSIEFSRINIHGITLLTDALVGALITSNDGKFEYKNNYAIIADRMITKNIFVRKSKITGGLKLDAANIDGDIDFTKSHFYNVKNEFAISLVSTNAGRLLMGDGFISHGVTDISSMDIKKDIIATGGSFLNNNPKYISLNVEKTNVHGEAIFDNCQFKNQVKLIDAVIGKCLTFNNSLINNQHNATLNADRLKVSGSLFLRWGFTSLGTIRLPDADITGDLDCDGAEFNTTDQVSMNAEKIKAGRVYFRNGFKSIGRINISNSAIHGGLICDGGKFYSILKNEEQTHDQSNTISLDISGSTINGPVSFNSWEQNQKTANFISVGEIILSDTTIEGLVSFYGAEITSIDNNPAIMADRIIAHRGVHFRNNFKAQGEVRLSGAVISGDFDCSGGKFFNELSDINKNDHAITAENIKAQRIFLNKGFIAKGNVDLIGANIDGVIECDGGNFESLKTTALNLSSSTIRGDLTFSNYSTNDKIIPFNSKGEICLVNAEVNGSIESQGGHFNNAQGKAINAQRIKSKNVSFTNNIVAFGETDFTGSTISGDFDCTSGKFNNDDGNAITLTNSTIRGSLNLCGSISSNCQITTNPFVAKGIVDFNNSNISGDIDLRGGLFYGSGGCAIYAKSCIASGDALFCDFMANGCIDFTNARIDRYFKYKKIDHPKLAKLVLRHAKIGILDDDDSSIPMPGNLDIRGFTYDAISENSYVEPNKRVEWIETQYMPDKLTFSTQPYEQLATYFKRIGLENAAKSVEISKNNDLVKYGQLHWWEYFFTYFLKFVMLYGYNKYLCICWMAAFILIGTYIFAIGHKKGRIILADKQQRRNKAVLKFQPFVYSVDMFFPLVNLFVGIYWLPKTKTYIRWYLWLHILFGWLLTTLFVAGLTGLIKN